MGTTEILIGRDAETCNYVVPKENKLVGRQHAKLIVQDNTLVLVDLDSANGTYINGNQVKQKTVTISDVIHLGDPSGYRVRVDELMAGLPMSDSEYSNRVATLEQVYQKYQQDMVRLGAESQGSMIMKRMGPTMVLGALTGIIAALVDGELKAAVGIIGGVLSILVFVVANMWSSRAAVKLQNEKNRVNEQFELDYVCPDCGQSWKGRSFTFLRSKGCCPSCKRKFNV